jgi:hypothetical protein
MYLGGWVCISAPGGGGGVGQDAAVRLLLIAAHNAAGLQLEPQDFTRLLADTLDQSPGPRTCKLFKWIIKLCQ